MQTHYVKKCNTMTKDEIRESMRQKRRNLSSKFINEAIIKITDSVISDGDIKTAKTVMVYLSAFREPDTRDIINFLLKTGIKTVVPVSNTDTLTITPSLISSMENLVKGAYGIYEPKTIITVPIHEIDTILVPAVAFSRSGDRLGFGKGYYDKLLMNFKGTVIGIGYDFQVIDELPSLPHDIRMNKIITEKRIYDDF